MVDVLSMQFVTDHISDWFPGLGRRKDGGLHSGRGWSKTCHVVCIWINRQVDSRIIVELKGLMIRCGSEVLDINFKGSMIRGLFTSSHESLLLLLVIG